MLNTASTHTTVKLPDSMLDDLERYVGKKGFTSKIEVIKQAVREYMDRNPLPLEKDVKIPLSDYDVYFNIYQEFKKANKDWIELNGIRSFDEFVRHLIVKKLEESE